MIDIAGSTTPKRQISIQNVGIKGLVYPVIIPSQGQSLAEFSMSVALPSHIRGTHMSRFISILQQQKWEVSLKSLYEMHNVIDIAFTSDTNRVKVDFTLMREKKAPVSGISSFSDYKCSYISKKEAAKFQQYVNIRVPVTTLCPCSKAISEYGAHSQRANIDVCIEASDDIDLNYLIGSIEQCGSSQLYSLLKRDDEKFVTEQAYDNPMFVEDSAREVAHLFSNKYEKEIKSFSVIVESIESIHNHSATAQIISPEFTNPEFF